MIKSKSVFEFRGRHDVLDADGHVIGQLEKDFEARCSAATGTSGRRGQRAARGARVELGRRAAPALRRHRHRLALAAQLAAVQLHAAGRRRGRDVQARAREVPRPLRDRARRGPADADRRLVVAFASRSTPSRTARRRSSARRSRSTCLDAVVRRRRPREPLSRDCLPSPPRSCAQRSSFWPGRRSSRARARARRARSTSRRPPRVDSKRCSRSVRCLSSPTVCGPAQHQHREHGDLGPARRAPRRTGAGT